MACWLAGAPFRRVKSGCRRSRHALIHRLPAKSANIEERPAWAHKRTKPGVAPRVLSKDPGGGSVKRLIWLFLVVGVVTAGLAVSALAQVDPTIVFTNSPASPTSVYDTKTHSFASTGVLTGTVNGTTTSFICDDDLNSIRPGDAWNSYAFNLTNVATYGDGQYAIPTASGTVKGTSIWHASGAGVSNNIQYDYDMAAYLADLLLTNAYTSSATINAIQWAIWDIMDSPASNGIADPGGSCTSTYTASSPTNKSCGQGWVNFALAHEENYSNPLIVFYTPTKGITAGPDKSSWAYGQEFIGMTSTPEPISMVLMGTFLGLAGIGIGKKKVSS